MKVQLDQLPQSPGVYLMKDARGEILYIGKARILADRVKSYFNRGAQLTPKIRSMVDQIDEVETILTGSDLEALILENNLIKKHRPKYNVVLRDDKNYPLLRLPVKDDYPRVEIVRRIKRDGALYFGPYVPAGALREMIRTLRRIFPLPNCTIEIDGTAERPCIEFEIKRCLAPCTGNQTKEDYREMIGQLRMFLEGKDRDLVRDLKERMERAAEALRFEEAARLRDQVVKVERALERQRITSATDLSDQDVIALARAGEASDVQILFIRGGMLIGRKDFFLERTQGAEDAELIGSFLQQFYNREVVVPKEIVVPVLPEEPETIERWLSEKREGAVRLVSPSRGRDSQLLRLAYENAEMALKNHLQEKEEGSGTLLALKGLLGLSKLPQRIEAFDISNIMGHQAVGSMVVFEGGEPKKSDYRRFKIRTIEGANDFGMMAEVLFRRYENLKEDGESLPDLILIDGGKGQLSAAGEALERLGLGEIDRVGLAKARGEKWERIFFVDRDEELPLPPA
ncbi:MAG TPA: excinuclease ABC subunit UvrC, partial [Nitrospiria bacterium]|nr:excinuclease ABC subunit UvrC [Nitrospiria bacterium]